MQNNSFLPQFIKDVNFRIKKILKNENKKASLNWLKIKKLRYFSSGVLRYFDFHNKKIAYTDPRDLLHGLREIFIDEIYQIELPLHCYIIDCGSNIGLSVIYLKEKHENAEVLAFEPDRNNFDLLEKNIKTFNLKNVTLEKKAVWIADTELDFSNDGNMESKIKSGKNDSNVIKVKAVQLKKYINRTVHFLKIDIEGVEYEVLKDIQENLHYVKNMFIEYHGSFEKNNQLVEMFNIIHQSGFIFYIKEAADIYHNPFLFSEIRSQRKFDIQLNIFCQKPDAVSNKLFD